jgi:hypothetical protein
MTSKAFWLCFRSGSLRSEQNCYTHMLRNKSYERTDLKKTGFIAKDNRKNTLFLSAKILADVRTSKCMTELYAAHQREKEKLDRLLQSHI